MRIVCTGGITNNLNGKSNLSQQTNFKIRSLRQVRIDVVTNIPLLPNTEMEKELI